MSKRKRSPPPPPPPPPEKVYWKVIFGNDLCVHGEHNTIVGDRCEIHGDRNSTVGHNNLIIGNHNFVNGNGSTVIGTKNDVAGNELTVRPEEENTIKEMGAIEWTDLFIKIMDVAHSWEEVHERFFDNPTAKRARKDDDDILKDLREVEGTRTESEDIQCVVCMEMRKEVVLKPCKHLCCCAPCVVEKLAAKMVCPICDEKIREVERVYIP